MKRKKLIVMALLSGFNAVQAMAARPAYDPSTLESTIVERFLGFVNEPSTYAYEMIAKFKKDHTNALNPDGGIQTPITRDQLSVLTTFKEEISQKYCDDQGICTVKSTKQELLITIPTVVRSEGITQMEKIIFTMKGGFKTLCKGEVCQDASVFYLPEDADIVVRSHGLK